LLVARQAVVSVGVRLETGETAGPVGRGERILTERTQPHSTELFRGRAPRLSPARADDAAASVAEVIDEPR
jgi:hypothetical protein